MAKTVIGVIGTVGSGKDTAGAYIAKKLNIPHFEVSAPLKEIAHERGLELSRPRLTEFGTEIAHEFGADYLAKVLLEKIKDKGVIAGMRQVAQIEYLKKHSNLTLIALDADPDIRFVRAKRRGKLGEATTVEELVKNEHEENSGHHAQRLFECIKLADFHIKNNGDVADMHSQIDALLAHIS